MNEAEKRRRQLLEQTRKKYGESRIPPAVHPRYSGVYSSLYKPEEEKTETGSLGFRAFAAIILFAVFIAMDYNNEKIGTVDSKKIVTEIESGVDIKEVWKNL